MTHTLKDIPIEQIMVEHYLFDLKCPIETVCKVSGMDRETVTKIYDDFQRSRLTKRSIK